MENESNATRVVLKHVTRANSGKFSCEVTTDQPGFLTDMKTATMEVKFKFTIYKIDTRSKFQIRIILIQVTNSIHPCILLE